MQWATPPDHPLRRLFAGYTEHTFQQTFGVADPSLIDYLSELLSRFVHQDSIHRMKNAIGQPMDQVAEMVVDAAEMPSGRTAREVHRHIGDFALFWTGMYPDSLRKFRQADRIDFFVDYCRQGKRSYYIASTFDDETFHDESLVLRRLSDDFEMCAYGLTKVREEWERDRTGGPKRIIGVC